MNSTTTSKDVYILTDEIEGATDKSIAISDGEDDPVVEDCQNKKLSKIKENLEKLREIINQENDSDDSAVDVDSPGRLTLINNEKNRIQKKVQGQTTIGTSDNKVTDTENTDNQNYYSDVLSTNNLQTTSETIDKHDKDQEVAVVSEEGQSAAKPITVKEEPADDGYPVIDPLQYRVKVEPESDVEDDTSSDSSSSSSSSESEEEEGKKEQETR